MKSGVGAVVGALAAAAVIYFFFLSPAITNYPPQEGPIVAFGDSLVAGTGASKGSDFASLLSIQLGRPIINLGTPGDTTEDGLARIEEVTALQPSVVLVLFGGNDYLQRVPPDQTFQNLRTIIEQLQEHGALVVVLGVRGGILRDNFAESFNELAKETNTAYVPDVLDGLIGSPALMYDQIHPNDAGHALIAGKIYAVIAPLL